MNEPTSNSPVTVAAQPPTVAKRQQTSIAVKVLIAAIPVVGSVAVAFTTMHSDASHSAASRLGKQAAAKVESAFTRFDHSVVRYLNAAGNFSAIFQRVGAAAFKDSKVHDDMNIAGTKVSAAYHELDETAPHYLLDLRRAFPNHEALLDDAANLRLTVINKVHEEGIFRLNGAINAINDTEGQAVSDEAVAAQLRDVEKRKAIVDKEIVLASDRLDKLRQRFRDELDETTAN